MLKLTKKTEYALIALRHLHSMGENAISSAREIAEAYSIPLPLLAKVLQELARKNYLRPVQGAQGGYQLSVKLDEVSMTDFFEGMEGPLGIMDCFFDNDCELLESCNIRIPIKRINESLRSMFDEMTILDVAH